jgi:hypothetical protein
MIIIIKKNILTRNFNAAINITNGLFTKPIEKIGVLVKWTKKKEQSHR